ncbi:MAG: hypothetical protein JWP61_2955 [Friedmanniella sp.]|nr:hypothetical protein [Friedmanniella sp.]
MSPGPRRPPPRPRPLAAAAAAGVLALLLTGCSAAGATPQHPTPAGTVRVLGLGDSVTTGYHCDCTDYITAFGRLLAQREHRPVAVDHEGQNGARTTDVATRLSDDPTVRREAGDAAVVVVTIGANDLGGDLDRWRKGGCAASCYGPDVDAMAGRLDRVLSELDRLRPDAEPGTVLVTTYWNVFADGRVGARAESDGYLDWSDAITRAADSAICEAARTAAARCVDLYTPFKGRGGDDPTGLLADDGDHPNPAGTALISRAVLAALPPSR